MTGKGWSTTHALHSYDDESGRAITYCGVRTWSPFMHDPDERPLTCSLCKRSLAHVDDSDSRLRARNRQKLPPGSDDAREFGCTCPVVDEEDCTLIVVDNRCPLHGGFC